MDPYIVEIKHEDIPEYKMPEMSPHHAFPLIKYGYFDIIRETCIDNVKNIIKKNNFDPSLIEITKKSLNYTMFSETNKISEEALLLTELINIVSEEDTIQLADFNDTVISELQIILKKKIIKGDGGYNFINLLGVDENNALRILMNDNAKKLKSLKNDSNLIIKAPSMMTQPFVEYIYYILCHFSSGYIIKPVVSNSLINENYIVFMKKMKDIMTFEYPVGQHFVSIFPRFKLPETFVNKIQLYNSNIINIMLNNYFISMRYAVDMNYYGPEYNEFVEYHNNLIEKWKKQHIDKTTPLIKIIN